MKHNQLTGTGFEEGKTQMARGQPDLCKRPSQQWRIRETEYLKHQVAEMFSQQEWLELGCRLGQGQQRQHKETLSCLSTWSSSEFSRKRWDTSHQEQSLDVLVCTFTCLPER